MLYGVNWKNMTLDREKYLHWIALGRVHHLGPVMAKRLLGRFGSPERIFGASERELLAVPDVGPKLAKSILKGPDVKFCNEQLDIAEKRGFRIIAADSAEYPDRLKQIYDPPYMIFVKGEIRPEDEKAVAIVGSRKATHYGKSMAEKLARELASANVTVVSGFARGIDSISHRAAIDAGGRTLAVFGSGLDVIYPPENKKMYAELPDSGALISEFPFGTKPEPQNFPRRNRIISGISLGVVVIEAGERSGALLTARHALEQNREVFAVPGNITSTASSGTNELIKQGAHLVTSAEDILSNLKFILPEKSEIKTTEKPPRLKPEQNRLYEILTDEPIHVDIISRQLGVKVPQVLTVLLEMELMGVVRQVPGKKFVKSNLNNYNG